MKNRPKITPIQGQGDLLLERIGWTLLFIVWISALYGYQVLPDQIPVHFDLSGHVNRFGSKVTLLMIPLIATLTFVGLSILNKYPHLFNYPFEITAENAEKQYSAATSLIRWLKLIIAGLFAFITLLIIHASNNTMLKLPQWLFLMMMLLFFLPIIFYFVSAKRNR